jgi:hypothetical protein
MAQKDLRHRHTRIMGCNFVDDTVVKQARFNT